MRLAFPLLFGITLFLSAALLFSVQPMIARMVLPLMGGAPAVWTTCMLFFQAALLAGYGYAHVATTRLGLGRRVVLHVALVASAFLFVPFALGPAAGPARVGEDDPTVGLLAWLTRAAGMPVVLIAATAPLLQSWFATTGHRSARDPYFLYGASNAGSLVALLAYPLWIEPRFGLRQQSTLWTAGLAFLAILVAVCATLTVGRQRPRWGGGQVDEGTTDGRAAIGATTRVGWVLLALVPSSLLLGVTTHVTTDLAPIPLLWVVPLALYLLSFVLAFSRPSPLYRHLAARALPFLIMVIVPVLMAGLVQPFWMLIHLATFFAAAMVCHGELARCRPAPSELSSFYLTIALGGALGGSFNALVAPLVFNRQVEYHLALAASCLVLAFRDDAETRQVCSARSLVLPCVIGTLAAALFANAGGLADSALGVVVTIIVSGLTLQVAATHWREPARFAATVAVLFLASGLASGVSGRVVHRRRSFFGALKVTEIPQRNVRRLFHGSTLHGQQCLDPARRREPLAYFTRSGPIGQVFDVINARPNRDEARVAVIGLGAGSLAAYALPRQRWTFYEIDEAVVRIARNPRFFTYLSDCYAETLDVVVGDGRLMLARDRGRPFDLIVLDAFNSDAIPIHLLTREAIALYCDKLADGGLIAAHISNRYIDLASVFSLLARDATLAARACVDSRVPSEEEAAGKQGSIWVVLARRELDLGPLARDPRWVIPKARPGDSLWTDDFSSVWRHFRLEGTAPDP
jgi:hypothetical protein